MWHGLCGGLSSIGKFALDRCNLAVGLVQQHGKTFSAQPGVIQFPDSVVDKL